MIIAPGARAGRLRRVLPAAALLLAAVSASSDSALALTEQTELRQYYLQAEQQLSRGKLSNWRKLKSKLKDYPLYPYLKLRELKAMGAKARYGEVSRIMKEGQIPIPSYFLSWWMKQLHSSRNWTAIISHFADARPVSIRCRYAEALYHARRSEAALEAIRPLWLVKRSQHKNCDTVFGLALKSGLISDQLVWERLLLTSARGASSMNKYLTGLLRSKGMAAWASRLSEVHRNPRTVVVANAKSWSGSAQGRDLIRYGINRIRIKDPRSAVKVWKSVKTLAAMSAEEAADIERAIAVSLATRHDALAIGLFEGLPRSTHDKTSIEWWARSVLLQQDWQALIKVLDSMDDEIAQRPVWQYWRAKSLHALGKADEARSIWSSLSKRSDYYGFLSADAIGVEYTELTFAATTSIFEYFNALDEPGIHRIREFLALRKPYSARRELNALGSERTPDFWRNLAHLFHHWGWHDGAIRAYRKTDFADAEAVELLFPRPFIQSVRREASRHAVPMPWIFGIMRQESLFVPDIRSGAGAIGLMQLIPSTARAEAKRQKLKAPTTRSLSSPQLNVRLGAGYLKGLLNRTDGNVIFALCGYNAGPRNMARWRASSPAKDARQWVEAIPFTETRRYVKKVLSNIIVYERLLELKTNRIGDYLFISDSET